MKGRMEVGTLVAGLLLLFAACGTANGAIALTSAGTAAGFSLSTFATGFPNSGNIGPIGIGFIPGGQVIVSSYAAGVNAVFATDTDNQLYTSAALSTSTFNHPSGIALCRQQHLPGRAGER